MPVRCVGLRHLRRILHRKKVVAVVVAAIPAREGPTTWSNLASKVYMIVRKEAIRN